MPIPNSIKPWLLVLLTAPVPLALFGILSVKWYQKRTDFTKTTQQFIQRQNKIIASDAESVASRIAALLRQSTAAVKTLPLLQHDRSSWKRFRESHYAKAPQWNSRKHEIDTPILPLFSDLSEWSVSGKELFHEGRLPTGELRNLYSCDVRNHCDKALIRSLLNSPEGTVRVGTVVRWYSPEGMEDTNDGAALWFGFHTQAKIYLAGLDYEHLKSVLLMSTFPYERRGDPLEGYQNGNYIYIVDSDKNMIAHPKYWHVYGHDRATGKVVLPIEFDSEDGHRPMNIARYRGEKLRQYFNRLLKLSFASKSVDIFSAPNLKGTNRVLATAPILFSEGQFQSSGVFGYVVTGCNVDYYEDPKEQAIPYY